MCSSRKRSASPARGPCRAGARPDRTVRGRPRACGEGTNFQGYADVQADADGRFRILTVRPGLYPVEGPLPALTAHPLRHSRPPPPPRHADVYFDDTDAKVLAEDKLLQHHMWGKTSPLPATIFAKLQKERSKLDATAVRYEFDIVL